MAARAGGTVKLLFSWVRTKAEQKGSTTPHRAAALRLAPSDEVYSELGRLCVATGDERRGTDYLMRSLGGLPALPLPSVHADVGPISADKT